ncbi:hypothetical protein D3C72_2166800 [compost metagenome]
MPVDDWGNNTLQVHHRASEYIATAVNGMNLQSVPNPTGIGLLLQSFGEYCRLEVANVLAVEPVRSLPSDQASGNH